MRVAALSIFVLLLYGFISSSSCKNPYKVLGVEEQASAQDIKRAYKKLAVQYHPDKVVFKSGIELMDFFGHLYQ